ncbi:hypothetical protein [Actinoplanes sp. URMC 104]|uniref:hypothetical protein n=1 Tax=Actinoplanes sp. URMC 104 TaxID=3423409 RepID=UPI003F19C65A
MPSTADGRRRARTGHRAAARRATPQPDGLSATGHQWNELLSSAAVILAGVLVVIGFGFIAARAMRGQEAAPPIDPPAPALGDVQLPSAGNPGPIPLTSPSATPSPSRSPSPSPARTPDRDQLRLAQGPVPSSVDLSAEGGSDWVHWGLDGTFSLERDAQGDFRILEGAPTAPRFRHALSPQKFRWSGGDPVASSGGTPTGIRTCGKGNGFTLTAPAGTKQRVLKLYVGVVAGRGKLTAQLTTGESSGSTVLDQREGTLRTAVITVAYQAPESGRLRLTWTTDAAYGKGCSGVALEAATLS